MNVLHISSGKMYGGLETMLVTLARERAQCPGMSPRFAVCFPGRLSESLRATGVPVHDFGEVRVRNPLTILRARARLNALLETDPIDIVICHLPWAQAIFGPVVGPTRKPLVFWCHGFVTGRHWVERWARRVPPALAIANSKATQQTLRDLYPAVPSQVVYCPVSLPPVPCPSERPNNVVIIQVSRMERWKGHLVHLEALARLKDLPHWVCWFVGGTQNRHERLYEDGLKETVGRLGLEGRVQFLGNRTDVGSLLASSDIFCQPNVSPEPFGVAFVEALHAGVPVVSTAIGGAADVVSPECGMLVPPRDPERLGTALRELIANPLLRARLGSAGPTRAKALCDPATQMERLHQLLQGLL